MAPPGRVRSMCFCGCSKMSALPVTMRWTSPSNRQMPWTSPCSPATGFASASPARASGPFDSCSKASAMLPRALPAAASAWLANAPSRRRTSSFGWHLEQLASSLIGAMRESAGPGGKDWCRGFRTCASFRSRAMWLCRWTLRHRPASRLRRRCGRSCSGYSDVSLQRHRAPSFVERQWHGAAMRSSSRVVSTCGSQRHCWLGSTSTARCPRRPASGAAPRRQRCG
mmetsp:Transcript_80710/g.261609  ORF Transcript_80710/g.261609 Transcript_80710/m.261609 type:complete len:226 (-) Transcript_80710:1350-2027(-)